MNFNKNFKLSSSKSNAKPIEITDQIRICIEKLHQENALKLKNSSCGVFFRKQKKLPK